jgi:TonB family protein
MTPYQIKIQRRRTLVSIGIALLLHLLLIGAYLIYEYLFVEDLAEFSGPVLVKLGEPEGEDLPVLPDPEAPEEIPEESVEPVPPPPAETVDVPAEAVSPAAPSEPSPEGNLPARPVSDATESADPADQPVEQPAAEETPVRPQPEIPAEPEPVIIKGEDGGNSYEYQFAAEEGLVRRSLSAEISLYMPLPRIVPDAVYQKIEGDSPYEGTSLQDLFRRYYGNVNDEWFYEVEPFTDDLRSLWVALRDAGYDHENADYKASGLNDVVITFTISEFAELLDAKILQSSSKPEVDEAVLEGFKAASFSNASGREIKGRFTYRFY